jgi:hypothetical protein
MEHSELTRSEELYELEPELVVDISDQAFEDLSASLKKIEAMKQEIAEGILKAKKKNLTAHVEKFRAILRELVVMENALLEEKSKKETAKLASELDRLEAECSKELSAKDPRVKYLSFSRNFGKESAMYAGLQKAKGDYVATMDADLQDPPSLLPSMYADLNTEEGYDCICTRRSTRKGEPPVRSFFARCFYKFINRISKTEFVDGARDFRLMKRQMVNAILSMKETTASPRAFSAGSALRPNGWNMKTSSARQVRPSGPSSRFCSIPSRALWRSPRHRF